MIPREQQADLLNDSSLSDQQRRLVTIGMDRMVRFGGIARIVHRHIDRHAMATPNRTLQVLVMPITAVEIPLGWARRSRKLGREIALTLVSADPDQCAESKIKAAIRDGYQIQCVEFEYQRMPTLTVFDLVVSLDWMHQLDRHQAFRQLQTMIGSTEGPLLVCDYARSRTNATLAKAASHLCSRSPIVHAAAESRIRGAYSIDEFRRLAEDALARPVNVRPLFPCHFIMTCDEKIISQPVPAFA